MKKLFITVLIVCIGLLLNDSGIINKFRTDEPVENSGDNISDIWDFSNWTRPDGPTRVGIQVGHWKNAEVPEELENIRNNTGATGGGFAEWEANYAIALEVERILEKDGVVVDLLPATVPPKYYADAFIAIHADGSADPSKSGFKATAPRRIIGDKAEKLLTSVEESYEQKTRLPKDSNITRNMKGYYVFRWWRYEHSLHPMTPAIILETGFLTSPEDRTVIVDQPVIPAQAIAQGITEYLKSEKLIKS
jgi:hypothetical protein